MKHTKIFIILLILLFNITMAFAFESPLNDFGFNGLQIEKALDRNCTTLDLTITSLDQSKTMALHSLVPILSLHTEFDNASNDNSYLSVKAGNEKEQTVWPEKLLCDNNACWARIFLPSDLGQHNKVEICLVTGGKTNNAKIFDDSFFGFYDSPRIEIETSAPQEISLGERARMFTKVKNTGTKDALISIQFVKEDTRATVEITSFDIIEGESTATTTLLSGQEKEFVYYIKPTKAAAYNLSSSIATFQNVFNETQGAISNHPQLVVNDLSDLEISLVSKEISPTEFEFKAIIKNNSNGAFEGTIILSPEKQIADSNKTINVNSLGEKTQYFYSKVLGTGKYSFMAKIIDGNNTYSSNTITIEVKPQVIPFEIILAIIGIIIAAGVIYFFYRKEKLPEEQK